MRTKWIYTILVLALGFFASCNNEADEAAGNKKTRTIVFRLAVDDAVGSRTTWGATYDTSDAEGSIENYINPNTLQVVVYEGTTFRGKATNVLSWPGTGEAECQFSGDLSHLNLVTGNSYHIMVLANCADVASTTQLSRLPYDISDLKNGIPMWGVKKLNLTDAEIQDIETIDLLRAAAKVEVALDAEKMSGYTLDSVSIKPYNTRGYCAPSGFNNSITETKALDRVGCYNPHASLAEGTSGHEALEFSLINEGQRAIVYVPEYDNKHTSSHAATITVQLSKDGEKYLYKDAIVFYEYNEGTPINSPENEYNIIRNHHYKFTVKGVSGGLLIKYAVNDWVYNVSTNITDLGTYGYPTYHNPLLPNIPASNEEVVTFNDPTLYHTPGRTNTDINETGAFVAYFKMTEGSQNWIPTLDKPKTDYIVRVYGTNNILIYSSLDSDRKTETTQLRASENWYTIKVIARDAGNVGTSVKLGITYQVLGTAASSQYLFINGTSDADVRWPNSGSDPKFIEITQVAESTNN